MSFERSVNEILGAVETLITFSGDNSNRPGLLETPTRFSAAWCDLTSGYAADPADVIKTFIDGSESYDGIVFQGRIPIYSLCEHHLLPFFGVAHIGYIPNNKIIGLSKMARVADVFARRLQVQERLTKQIAEILMQELDAIGVGVVLKCRHMCLESRGVQKSGTTTHTSSLLGAFRKEPETRSEFMNLVASAEVGLSI